MFDGPVALAQVNQQAGEGRRTLLISGNPLQDFVAVKGGLAQCAPFVRRFVVGGDEVHQISA